MICILRFYSIKILTSLRHWIPIFIGMTGSWSCHSDENRNPATLFLQLLLSLRLTTQPLPAPEYQNHH